MGRTRGNSDRPTAGGGALTSPPPSSSSSSSDFEFTVSLSPSSRRSTAPADELFYKGNLLPLHLSPRISMVRTLLLASSSTSSSSDATTSRDSNGSSSSSSAASDFLLLPPDCDSSRPSSATEEDVITGAPKRLPRRPNYFSSLATRFSSVFIHRGGSKKAEPTAPAANATPATVDLNKKPTNNPTAKQVIKKYVKKVKPLYEKLSSSSQKQNQPLHSQKNNFSFSIKRTDTQKSAVAGSTKVEDVGCRVRTQSFSGNLKYPRRKKCAGSCPSSMRSSPSHSGLLSIGGGGGGGFPEAPAVVRSASSSMEELQSAIQGAIAHCKSSQRKVPATADEIGGS